MEKVPRDQTDESAFFKVMTDGFLFSYIVSFQKGRPEKRWYDGDYACYMGHLEMLKKRYKYMHFSEYPIDSAVRSGNMELIMWLISKGMTGVTNISLHNACHYGHLHILKWLLENYTLQGNDAIHEALRCAIRSKHKHIVEYILEKRHNGGYGLSPIKDDLKMACTNGTCDIIQLVHVAMRSIVLIDNNDFIVSAISNNNLDGVKWIFSNLVGKYSYFKVTKTIEIAIKVGSEDI